MTAWPPNCICQRLPKDGACRMLNLDCDVHGGRLLSLEQEHGAQSKDALQAEIERLRALLDHANTMLTEHQRWENTARDQIADLKRERRIAEAEVERLRALLQEVAGCFTTDDGLPDKLLPRIDTALKDLAKGKVR